MLLKGKNAIITGCNRGIGKAILEAFAANGANVFACIRRDTEEFNDYVKELSQRYNIEIWPLYFDLADQAQIKQAAKEIQATKKSIDVLVNNAGITYNALFQMSSMDKLQEVFNINFYSMFLLTQYISKLMMRQKYGSIINIASSAAIDANPGKSIYGASKAAVICMTKAISRELGEHKIRANAIAPGVTDTEMLTSMSDIVIKDSIQNSDLKRVGKPSEIAETAVFLASDLSAYITGQVIRVDGGLK